MNKQPFKELFNKMRELGYFGNYETYEAYRDKYDDENFGKEEPPKDVEGWKQGLSEEDKSRYNKMFNF